MCGLAREVVCCIVCFVCLGPILIIIGLIVLFGFAPNNTRGTEVGQYNMAVTDWTNTYRTEFASSNGFTAGDNVALNQDTTPDTLNDGGSDLNAYTALKYSKGALTIPAFQYTTGQSVFLYNLQITVGTPNKTITVPIQVMKTVSLTPFQLGCSTTGNANFTSCTTACARKNGNWDPYRQLCQVSFVVSNACIKIAKTVGWDVDAGYGGNGCYYVTIDDAAGYATNFPVETLVTYPTPANNSTVTLQPIPLTIRHTKDPYIAASSITTGSYNFGLSTATKVGIGLILIIVGAVFMAPVIITVVLIVYCCRKRQNSY